MKRIIVKKIQTRRSFITKLIGAGVIINLPLLNSCVAKSQKGVLGKRKEIILKTVLEFLYPSDGNGPSLEKVRTYDYFIWNIRDNYLDPEENKYLLDGLKWIDETAMEKYEKHFEELNAKEKYKLLKAIVNEGWGENYFSKVLSVIVESMFADPIYGSNPDGVVWEWYNHNPGLPRPKENNKYQTLLMRKKENVIITDMGQL